MYSNMFALENILCLHETYIMMQEIHSFFLSFPTSLFLPLSPPSIPYLQQKVADWFRVCFSCQLPQYIFQDNKTLATHFLHGCLGRTYEKHVSIKTGGILYYMWMLPSKVMPYLLRLAAPLMDSSIVRTPTPWLMRIRFTQISITLLFKRFPFLT